MAELALKPCDMLDSDVALTNEAVQLLSMPRAVLDEVLEWLPPADLCRFGFTTDTSKIVAHAAHLWQHWRQRTFPDVPDAQARLLMDSPTDEPMPQLVELAFRRSGTSCPFKFGCAGSLLVDKMNRCPCVAARTRCLPLRLGSLVARRSGSSALSCGGFSVLLATLRRHFVVEHTELDTLQDDTLAPLDMLVLCTTEGPALAEAELLAIRTWVEHGGALIANAFANWSAHGHYAAQTVGWLGLKTIPWLCRTIGNRNYKLITPDAVAPGTVRADIAATNMLLAGPFGQPAHFFNLGESYFRVLPDAVRYGVVRLTVPTGGDEDDLATLVFYPPRPMAQSGVTGKGRVLVSSNYHWLADAGHWCGGLFAQRHHDDVEVVDNQALRPNQSLLLNFVAGAVAARANQ